MEYFAECSACGFYKSLGKYRFIRYSSVSGEVIEFKVESLDNILAEKGISLAESLDRGELDEVETMICYECSQIAHRSRPYRTRKIWFPIFISAMIIPAVAVMSPNRIIFHVLDIVAFIAIYLVFNPPKHWNYEKCKEDCSSKWLMPIPSLVGWRLKCPACGSMTYTVLENR